MRNVATVSQYLSALSPDERAEISRVRRVIRQNLPAGFKESVQWGMICYTVPLSRFSSTYNGQALCYAALAAQKNYHSLYLMNVYGSPAEEKRFRARFKASGHKLDMGKSCVRFRSADDLPLDLIGETIAATSVDDFIAQYQRVRGTGSGASKTAGRKKKGTKKR